MLELAPIDWFWLRDCPQVAWGRPAVPLRDRVVITVTTKAGQTEYETPPGCGLFGIPVHASDKDLADPERVRQNYIASKGSWPPPQHWEFAVSARLRGEKAAVPPIRFVPSPALSPRVELQTTPVELRWSAQAGAEKVRVAAVRQARGKLAFAQHTLHSAPGGGPLPSGWVRDACELLVTPVAADGRLGPTEWIPVTQGGAANAVRRAFPETPPTTFEQVPAVVLTELMALRADSRAWDDAVRVIGTTEPAADYLRRPHDLQKLVRERGLSTVVSRWGWPSGASLSVAGALLQAWDQDGPARGAPPAARDELMRYFTAATDPELDDWLVALAFGLSPEEVREFRVGRGWPLDPYPFARAVLALKAIRHQPLGQSLASEVVPGACPPLTDALRLEEVAGVPHASLKSVEEAARTRQAALEAMAARLTHLSTTAGTIAEPLHMAADALTRDRVLRASELLRRLRQGAVPDAPTSGPDPPLFCFEVFWQAEHDRIRRERTARSRRVAGWCLRLIERRELPMWPWLDESEPETAVAAWASVAPVVAALPGDGNWVASHTVAAAGAALRAAAAEAVNGQSSGLAKVVKEMSAEAARLVLWLNHDAAVRALRIAIPELANRPRTRPGRERAAELTSRPVDGLGPLGTVAAGLRQILTEEQTWTEALRAAGTVGSVPLNAAVVGDLDTVARAVAAPELRAAIEQERGAVRESLAGAWSVLGAIGAVAKPSEGVRSLQLAPPRLIYPDEYLALDGLLAVATEISHDRTCFQHACDRIRVEQRIRFARLREVDLGASEEAQTFEHLFGHSDWDGLRDGFETLVELEARAPDVASILDADRTRPSLAELLAFPRADEWAGPQHQEACVRLRVVASALARPDTVFVAPAALRDALRGLETSLAGRDARERFEALGDVIRDRLVHLARRARAELLTADVPLVEWPVELPAFLDWLRAQFTEPGSDPSALTALGLS